MYIGWEKASSGSGKVNFTSGTTVLVSLVVTYISAVFEQESQSSTYQGVISVPQTPVFGDSMVGSCKRKWYVIARESGTAISLKSC